MPGSERLSQNQKFEGGASYQRRRDEASFLSSFTLCQTETTEAKLFSLEEAIESDEVTRATKRQLIYYHSYVVENTGRVIESTLGSGVLYKGKTY